MVHVVLMSLSLCQCESKNSSLKRHISEDAAPVKDDEYEDSEDELDMTLSTKMSRYMKQGLYYITDSERFQPPRKRPKYLFELWILYRIIVLL